MLRYRLGLAVSAAVLLLAARSPDAATQQELSFLKGPDREKILMEGAAKEGEISLYTSLDVDQAIRNLQDGFRSRYPKIELKFVRSDTAQFLQRLMAEKRANSIRVDVIISSIDAALEQADLAQPWRSPVMEDYPKEYVERTGATLRTDFQGIAWNTKMVTDADAPRTWEALIDPKWKGKLAWSQNPSTGAGRLITHLRKIKGEDAALDYFKKLKANDIRTLPGSVRTVLDQVIAGEAAVGVSMAMHHIAISKSAGAPIDGTTPEPVITRGGMIHIVKGAPHPHAAILFADFMLAKDGGQKILRDVQYNPTHPGLEPMAEMRWIVPRFSGKKELMQDAVEVEAMQPRSLDIFKELFR
jgi:iron(III) transport system substrate-binding protein